MRVPKYRKNPDGRAFVEYRGKRHYLGKHNSHVSKEKYKQFVARIMAQSGSSNGPIELDVDPVLAEAYADWAEGYYESRGYGAVRVMLEEILGFYGETPISQFGPRKILVWQQWLVNRGLSVTTINQRLGHLKRWLR